MTKQEAQLYWTEKIASYKKSNLPVRTWCRQQNTIRGSLALVSKSLYNGPNQERKGVVCAGSQL